MPGLPFQNLPAAEGQETYLDPGSQGFAGPRIQLGIGPSSPTGGVTSIGPGSPERPQTDPFEIIESQFKSSQRELFNYFDRARYELDQQTLDPKQYLQAVDDLHENTRRAEFTLRQRADSQIESMGQIVNLMKEKRLDVKTGQRALYKLAGISDEAVDSMFPDEPKPVDPMKLHASLIAEGDRLLDMTDKFVPGIKGLGGGDPNKLYRSKVDKKGFYTNKPDTKNEATDNEFRTWLMAGEAHKTIQGRIQEVVSQMPDFQQAAFMGMTELKKRAGMNQVTPPTSMLAPVKWWEYYPPAGAVKHILKGGYPGMLYRAEKSVIERRMAGTEPVSSKIRVQSPEGREMIVSEQEWNVKNKNGEAETEGWSRI